MKLRVGRETIEAWRRALRRAGAREIGGVLFGEQIGEGDFRIVEATRQMRGGRDALFRRKGAKARKQLKKLSAQYGDPRRFNYLGEWHSHPSAPTWPSLTDQVTMHQLVAHPDVAANFLVLLINRLNGDREIELSAMAFLPGGRAIACEIVIETSESAES